jgi:hypothetical protein
VEGEKKKKEAFGVGRGTYTCLEINRPRCSWGSTSTICCNRPPFPSAGRRTADRRHWLQADSTRPGLAHLHLLLAHKAEREGNYVSQPDARGQAQSAAVHWIGAPSSQRCHQFQRTTTMYVQLSTGGCKRRAAAWGVDAGTSTNPAAEQNPGSSRTRPRESPPEAAPLSSRPLAAACRLIWRR